MNEQNISIFKSILNDQEFRKKFLRGAISFPVLVGFVGAAEFTCNDKIREAYGKIPGIIASALSGAAFLAPGDHYMLRQEKFGENFRQATKFLKNRIGFFVGFPAVTMREAIFMTNMIYVGPWVGKLMQAFSEKDQNE